MEAVRFISIVLASISMGISICGMFISRVYRELKESQIIN